MFGKLNKNIIAALLNAKKPNSENAFSTIKNSTQLLGFLPSFNQNKITNQPLILMGGIKFIIVDVVYTNATTSLDTQNVDIEIWDSPSGQGNEITSDAGGLAGLTTPDKFTSVLSGGLTAIGNFTVGNVIYPIAVNPPLNAKIDIYVYGYILN